MSFADATISPVITTTIGNSAQLIADEIVVEALHNIDTDGVATGGEASVDTNASSGAILVSANGTDATGESSATVGLQIGSANLVAQRGDLLVQSLAHNQVNVQTDGNAGAIIGVGIQNSRIDINSNNQLQVLDDAQLVSQLGDVTLLARSSEDVTIDAVAGSGGALAISEVRADVDVTQNTTVNVGAATIEAGETLTISSRLAHVADVRSNAESFAVLGAIPTSRATLDINGSGGPEGSSGVLATTISGANLQADQVLVSADIDRMEVVLQGRSKAFAIGTDSDASGKTRINLAQDVVIDVDTEIVGGFSVRLQVDQDGINVDSDSLAIAAIQTGSGTFGDIVLSVRDASGSGQNLFLETGQKISAAAGAITLDIGDDFELRAGAEIGAATVFTLLLDQEDADTLRGSSAIILGTLDAGNALVIEGGADGDTINLAAMEGATPIEISTGAGADSIRIGSVDGKLDLIGADVLVDAGDDDGDTLTLDDSGSTAARTGLVVGANAVTDYDAALTGLTDLNGDPIDVNYAGVENFNLLLGSNLDKVRIRQTPAGTLTTIDLGAPADEVTVGDASSTLNQILGGITIEGNLGNDIVTILDSGDTLENTTGTLTVSALTGLGLGGPLTLSEIGTVDLSLGSGGDTFTVEGVGATTTVRLGGGDDTVVISGSIENFNEDINLVGNATDSDTLSLSFTQGAAFTLSPTQLTSTQATGVINYSGLSNIVAVLSDEPDFVTITDTSSPIDFNSGGGADTLNGTVLPAITVIPTESGLIEFQEPFASLTQVLRSLTWSMDSNVLIDNVVAASRVRSVLGFTGMPNVFVNSNDNVTQFVNADIGDEVERLGDGPRAANIYLGTNASTPYIPNLIGGAELYGFLDGIRVDQIDFDISTSIVDAAPTNALVGVYRLDAGLSELGFADHQSALLLGDDLDLVLVVNLTDMNLELPRFGVQYNGSARTVPLAFDGLTNSTGAPVELTALNAGTIWATVIRETDSITVSAAINADVENISQLALANNAAAFITTTRPTLDTIGPEGTLTEFSGLTSLVQSADGTQLYAAAQDREALLVIDANTNRLTQVFEGNVDGLADFADLGKIIASTVQTVGRVYSVQVSVEVQQAADSLHAEFTGIESISVGTAGGEDAITLYEAPDAEVASLSIRTGDQNDTIELQDFSATTLVQAGDGADTITLITQADGTVTVEGETGGFDRIDRSVTRSACSSIRQRNLRVRRRWVNVRRHHRYLCDGHADCKDALESSQGWWRVLQRQVNQACKN